MTKEAARELPLDKFETDAPTWLLLLNYWPNEQTIYTRYVVDFHKLRGMTTEELAVAATANAERILDWTASDERKISQVIVVEGRDDTANLMITLM